MRAGFAFLDRGSKKELSQNLGAAGTQ